MSRLRVDDRIVGRVAGSGGRVYSVDATLGRGADGRLSNVDGHCSCPIGYNCKHVTAVLLDVAQTLVDRDPETYDISRPKSPSGAHKGKSAGLREHLARTV